jgi:cyclohexanone monooxygenase
VKDPAIAEALKPYYRYLCKRPCFHDDYLATFNLPNVSLVNAERGIDRIVSRGLVVEGVEYEVDCLIFASGFEFDTPYTHRGGFDVVGRNEVTLSAKWQRGLSTLHGLMTRDFPNMFFVPGPNSQSVVTVNVTHSLTENALHIAHIIEKLRNTGLRFFDVATEAESKWVDTIIDRSTVDVNFRKSCTPGRDNHEGRPHERPATNINFGGGPLEFFELLREWRAEGDLAGLILVQ